MNNKINFLELFKRPSARVLLVLIFIFVSFWGVYKIYFPVKTSPFIFITKAYQLDANKTVIANIYNQTLTKDNVWASIKDGQYVRVTFSKILNNKNENIIYARPTSPSQPATIEVYPVYNSTEGSLLATFPTINHEGTYKILLSNLVTPTDIFDFKVNGNTDIDYIVDPATSSILGTTGTNPVDITIDPSGNIYTVNSASNTVSKITPAGVSTILGNTGTNPYDITIDLSGNIYTANLGSSDVSKITPGGTSTILGTTGVSPFSITIDPSGNIYTANYGSNNVTKITPAGTSTILGTTGTNPHDITIDLSGNIYTANLGSSDVSKITPGGTSTILGTTGTNPRSITVDSSGNIYTANQGANNVTKITPGGASTTLGTTGSTPYSIIIDSSGNIYTVNVNSNNVSKITPAGISTILGTTGSLPEGITIDSSGNIYTANFGSNNVTKLTLTVPDAPTIGTATAGIATATVPFTAPASDGGSTITGYTVTSSPAGGTDTNAGTTALSHLITGLTNGTAYTFTVKATNAVGTSPASAASNSVTPSIPVPFISTWDTTKAGSASTTIVLPISGTYNVDWGDGTINSNTATHVYSVATTSVTINITGTGGGITGWSFNNAGDKLKIKNISQWGNLHLGNAAGYFYGCLNLKITAVDVLSLIGTTNLQNAFRDSGIDTAPSMNSWDVSGVTGMNNMFSGASTFNQNIGSWNVSNVTDMNSLFKGATLFNQNIGSWNVSKVTDMNFMFNNATSFNQNLGSWNVSSVVFMSDMFDTASAFNNNGTSTIGNWNVSSTTNMGAMFLNAAAFNQNIGGWNVSNVTAINSMFSNATSFNQNLGGWNVSKVTDMSFMFDTASAFNNNGTSTIGNWNVSSTTNMSGMFQYATLFNQNIGGWNVSNVTNMVSMFTGVTLSTANYNALLQGWSALALQHNVSFDGGNSKYDAGAPQTARQSIINSFTWTITDGGSTAIIPRRTSTPTSPAPSPVTTTVTPTTTQSVATTTLVVATSTLPVNFCFAKNLYPNTSDADIKNLQIFLNNNGFPTTVNGSETNYYGIETVNGVKLFQEYYTTEILAPLGLTIGTGNFGTSTRNKVNGILGCATTTATTTPTHIDVLNQDLTITKEQSGTYTKDTNVGKIVLNVPASNVPSKSTFSIIEEPLTQSNKNLVLTNKQLINDVFYNISAKDNLGNPVHSFTYPNTINLPVSASLAGSKDLAVYYLDEVTNQWILVPSASFVNGQVIFQVNHLTKFAIFPAPTYMDKFQSLLIAIENWTINFCLKLWQFKSRS